MKQTNNAIKFLMAQYRAIFNHAYFKGLATAALVTVAMAAGQAQAASGDLADFISGSSKTDVKGDFTTTNASETLSGTGGYLTNLTITNGKTLTFGVDGTASTDHLHVYKTLSVQSGGILNLKGHGSTSAGWGVVGATNEAGKDLTDFKATSKLFVDGGNVSIDKSQIQMASVVLNNAIVEIKNNLGDVSTSNFADNAQLTANAVYNDKEQHIEGTGVFSVTGDKTKITLDSGSILNAAVFNFDGGAIDMKGDEAASSGAMIRAYSNGGKVAAEINFKGTDLNITDSGNYIGGKVVNLKTGSDIKLADSAELHLSGVLETAGDIAASNHAGTINLDGAAITLSGSKSKLIIDVEGSVFNANSGSIDNKGEIKFNNKLVNTTAELLEGMAGGKITMASGGEINVTSGAVDLSTSGLKFIKDNGTLDNAKLALSAATTFNANDLTLGSQFDVANLDLNTNALTVGDDFTQTKGTFYVDNTLTGSGEFTVGASGGAAKFELGNSETKNGTISGIDTINVGGDASNSGSLTITGDWSGLTNTAINVKSGGAFKFVEVREEDSLTVKSLEVADGGKLYLQNSNLTVTDTIKNAAAEGVELKELSSVSASYAKVTESDVLKSDIKNFKLDGSSKIILTGRQAGVIEKTKLDALKKALLGDGGNGLLEVQGATLSDTDSGISGGKVNFATAQGNSGLSGIYENATVTGANAAVTGANSWGSVQLADSKSDLEIASEGTVTLNGVNGKLVAKNDGSIGGVALNGNADFVVNGNGGTLANITASTNKQGRASVNAAVNVNGDIGAKNKSLQTVYVMTNGQLNTSGDIYTKELVNDGSLVAQNITVSDYIDVSNGSLTADKITTGSLDIFGGSVTANKIIETKRMSIAGSVKAGKVILSNSDSVVEVGNENNTGVLEVGSLDLKGGKLVLDPEYGQPSTIVAITEVTNETDGVVSVGGDIGVGKNSILAVGTTADEAKALLTKLNFFDGVSLKEAKGAVLVANESLHIANGDQVILNSKASNDDLTAALSGGNSFALGADSALVVTDNLASKTSDGSKAIIQFANSGTATVTLASGSKLDFETALSEQNKITLSNATAQNTTNNGVVISAAGGLLDGKYDPATGKISFKLNPDKLVAQTFNMSAPVQELAVAALKGNKDYVELDKDGTKYIQTMTGLDGGKAVEETARLAVYGGTVQATNLAQHAATDAVVDRMSRANPNGSLVFADNAQGSGLWLSPVYKSHESDSFGADGVSYGVDANLAGLVLGGDFTFEPGIRAGAYFNFGSASIDGQDIGDKVSNDADYFGLGLYAGMTFGQISLVADAGFTQLSNDIEQTPSAKVSKVTADVDSNAITLGLRGEYKLNLASMDVTPHLGVRYTRLDVDSYDAKADGLVVANTDFDTMQMVAIPFGVTISKNIAVGDWTVKPVFDLTLTANAGDTEAKLDTTFVGTKTLDLTSDAFDSFTYGATFGIDAKYGEKLSVGLNTNYVGSSNADEFGVMGNVRYMF